MPDTGTLSPSAAVTSNAVGTVDWSNPTNVYSGDDSDASAAGVANARRATYYLKASGFSAAVPTGAMINGIEVSIERAATTSSSTNKVIDGEVKIIKADGSIGTTNKAATLTLWPTSDTKVTYGSSTDLWGETWTPADINDADFGVAISVNITVPNRSANTAYIDYIAITVYYTVANFFPFFLT